MYSYTCIQVTGLYGLKFFASLAHPPKAKTASNPIDSRKLTVFGGKGGVGKTTSSASWTLSLCEAGFRTLVVSTDPAHSLGDALQEKLAGIPKQLDTSFLSAGSGGSLWAMEIDPQMALAEFKDIVDASMGSDASSGGGMLGSMGLPDVQKDLADMLGGVSDPPPGTDEIVALTKLIAYLKNGYTTPDGRLIKFDRIVLDTAPTGHTLRMLQLPPFLLTLVGRLRGMRDKTGSLGGMFGGGGSSGASEASDKYDQVLNDYGFGDDPGKNSPVTDSSSKPVDRLTKFEDNMKELQSLLHNPKECEFTIVTIPTEMATAESARLLQSLHNEHIAVRRVLINQVIPTQTPSSSSSSTTATDSSTTTTAGTTTTATTDASTAAADAYLNRLRIGQKKCITELKQISTASNILLTEIPYFDMEIRTVYGLRVISNFLLPKVLMP